VAELERYSAEDDVVRNLIDRKARVFRSRARVEEVGKISRVTAASPIKQSTLIKRSKIIY
jgi:CelD/BcsL family acetyltransferase involved in cellulose biosynthesis